MLIKNPAWMAAAVTVWSILEDFQLVGDAIGGKLHKRS